MFIFYNNLDVVEVGIELVVLAHEIIESPHLGKYCHQQNIFGPILFE